MNDRIWSETELKRLKSMRESGISVKEIAKELCRSVRAVTQKLYHLGIKKVGKK